MSEWQPIETAPRDGRAIMLANAGGAWIGKYMSSYRSGYVPDNPWFSLMLNHDHMCSKLGVIPTHWMPMPKAPK